MAKGLFTQGMCVLLRQAISIDEIRSRLSMFQAVAVQHSTDDDAAPDTLVFRYRPEVNGHLLVTPSDAPWPDDMGEPDENPEAFVAWSLGQYGPLTYPGCFARAVGLSHLDQARRDEAIAHTAHVRILISYVVGIQAPGDINDELPMLPDDYDAVQELRFITRVVAELLELPQAICYFNPGGEVLQDAQSLRQGLNVAWNYDLPPLEMWTASRHFEFDQGWDVIDILGNGQFDLPDMEAVYSQSRYPRESVSLFLRKSCFEMVHNEHADAIDQEEYIADGDTVPGPGDVDWVAMICDNALHLPPRPTIRWIPADGIAAPSALLVTTDDEDFIDDDPDDDQGARDDQSQQMFDDALDDFLEFSDDELDEDLEPPF